MYVHNFFSIYLYSGHQLFKSIRYDKAMKDKQSFVPLFYLSSFSKSLCKKATAVPRLGRLLFCVIPPLQPKTLQRLSLNARGRGTQWRAPVIAGAISQRLPCVGFFGIFLAETRKIPAGGTKLTNANSYQFNRRIWNPPLHYYE